MHYILPLHSVSLQDINIVGGKNASLGEMIQHLSPHGIHVPLGFATTVDAYQEFLSQNGLEKKIHSALFSLKVDDISSLKKTAKDIQKWIMAASFSLTFKKEIEKCYRVFHNQSVAVRSSATAEDLLTASFAGQQETFLNVKGLKNVLEAIKRVFASLFTERAIVYRHHQGFPEDQLSISAGIQPMVRSDKGASGVIFTLDTESNFDQVILITASYGLGEAIVQGRVNPDEFCVSKPLLEINKQAILQRRLGEKSIKMVYATTKDPRTSIKIVPVPQKERLQFCLTDSEIITLAKYAMIIEKHYQRPMDIEWAKDGNTGKLYIVQARPETINAQKNNNNKIERFFLPKKGKIVVEGQSIGQRIGKGRARVILNPRKMSDVKEGEILVTDMTDPDWEPIMKRAAAIVTNRGGRTCHAAIIARELGIPAVVGCSTATKRIKTGDRITVSCAEGQIGYVYSGLLPYQIETHSLSEMPAIPVKLCINLGNPERAFACRTLPNDGVGLARLEFIINNVIGVHPNALLNFNSLPAFLKKQIIKKTAAYKNPKEFYIEKLREGISTIAAAFYPKQVIFRFSDFKSNEYSNLLGGNLFEPREENPMLGYRGAARYIDSHFIKSFKLECEAFKRVRNEMGLSNAQMMVPFVRTVDELINSIKVIESCGLVREENNLKIYMMCEVPSNALMASEFLKHVDGFSIGSNDLTQLTLGLDRDSNLVSSLFDERNEAVKILLHQAINECNKQGKYIGICGQGPSDHIDFAEWLVEKGIQNISLSPDSIVETWLNLSKKFSCASSQVDKVLSKL